MPSTSETRKRASSTTQQQSQTLSKFFLPKSKTRRQHHDDDNDDDVQEVKSLVLTKHSSNHDGVGRGKGGGDKEQLLGTTADNPLSVFDDDDSDVDIEDNNDGENFGKTQGGDDMLPSPPPLTNSMPISTTCEKEEEEENPKSTNNLFAMFAYRPKSSPGSGPSSSSPSKKPRTQFNLIQGVHPSMKATKAAKSATTKTPTSGETSKQCPAVRTTFHTNPNAANKNSSKTKKRDSKGESAENFVRMKDLSLEEQERITRKWQSLADPNAPLEVRRFQVLVASRLHARCQEPSVRKAMAELRQLFHDNNRNSNSNDGSNVAATTTTTTTTTTTDSDSDASTGSYFNVRAVAKADPEVLAHYLSNLQFYNVKAKHIVQASKQIVTQFGGIVPEDEHSLLQIIGIGKTFADLLAFVNTRKAWAAAHPATSAVNS